MNLVFANPWGFLGLLGVPALIAIYYLRRRAKVETINTLFLLQRAQKESAAGKRFEHFNNSLPFWLQLLGILLLTLLLTRPRYGVHRTTQQVAIVLDSSASMRTLIASLPEELEERLTDFKGDADHASYYVLDHEPRRPRLYQGDDEEELIESLDQWDPTDGAVDPRESLRFARSLVGPGGLVVYLTDHDGPGLPFSAERVSLGTARANVGFTGVSFEEEEGSTVWLAVLRNYSDTIQSREWSLETLDGKRTDPVTVSIEPRRFAILKGRFPEGSSEGVLRLEPDDFEMDDVLPMVEPAPYSAALSLSQSSGLEQLRDQMVRGFAHVRMANGEGDLLLTSTADEATPTSSTPLISDRIVEGEEKFEGRILMVDDPLMKGLNWQALRTGKLGIYEPRDADRPLLWLDERPLIYLGFDEESRAPQLIFNFSLKRGNALKLPATAVLLHRFTDRVARNTLTSRSVALETGQRLSHLLPDELDHEQLKVTVRDLAGESRDLSVEGNFRSVLRAPNQPGFVSVRFREKPLLEGSVFFADTREADLSGAASANPEKFHRELSEAASREDGVWRWFVVGLLLLLLAAWYCLSRSHPEPRNDDS